MKHVLILGLIFLLLSNCTDSSAISTTKSEATVSNKEELYKAVENAEPGMEIVLTNGIWKDVNIRITADGTEDKPITLRAETPGEVLIQGESDLQLGGDYLIVEGLYFVDGHSPSKSVIKFAVEDTVANHCIVTNCVIKDYNKLQRNFQDLWVVFRGRHNQLDHCYLAGKSNRGPTIRVEIDGNESINNYHQIVNNHFGPRPPKGGPSAETIQIGDSYTSMSPSYTMIANNLFEECNGEVEIISSKTNFNEFRNNVFYQSEGSLVTRHGNYCTVDGNYFIGSKTSANEGGVRLIGTGHVVTNNYFYQLKGKEFRSPLAVMNGIPKSPLNRYIQVTDVVIAYNSWIDCTSPLQFGVGSNVSQKDVLPASEIRSARPIRTVVANNLIYNTSGDETPIVAHDKLDGILFKSNLINNQGVTFEPVEGVEEGSYEMQALSDHLWVPSADALKHPVYSGFGFDQFNKDIFGVSRDKTNTIGAMVGSPSEAPPILDKSKYGTDWYTNETSISGASSHTVSSAQSFGEAVLTAKSNDTILLQAGEYEIFASLKIDIPLTIQASNEEADVTFIYKGRKDTPLFQMFPNGQLDLKWINVRGDNSQYAFASLKQNMSSLYNLSLEDCKIENFNYILKAYKYSFAEHLTFRGSTFKNCENGIELSEEIEDKGEYNAENLTIDACQFEGISRNVVDYYRGGYDESTVGGNLAITNSSFTNCGAKEENGVLLNTYGIINVLIKGNTFSDNPVRLVAQLWGAKNNSHSDNKISNSGEIAVEENLKLNLLY